MRTRSSRFAILPLLLTLGMLAACNQKPVRTDAQLAADTQNKIYSDGSIQSRQIGVQANNGVVTLSGNVASEAERAAAANDAATIDGVKTVVNNLQVQQAQATPPPVQQQVAPPPAPAPAPAPARVAREQRPRESRRERERSLPATSTKGRNPGSSQGEGMGGEALQAGNSNSNNTPLPVATPVAATPAVQTPPPPPAPPKKVTVPAGTQVTVRLSDPLDSERNQVGDSFHGTLGAPIVIDDQTVIPTGADVTGRVADVKSAGRLAGQSVLTLELTSLATNGRTYNIQTNQWSRQGKGEGKNTAIKAGGGAALGAIIGGLAGGGRGAAIGAAAGGATGTGVAATRKGEQIKLGPETTLNFQLLNPLTVTPQSSSDRNAGRTPLD